MGTTRRQHDVAIVGARAGGGALALLLARMGHDVVVVDRALLPSDTLSTHSLARSGVVQLNRWGLLDEVLASGAPAVREVAFHTAEGSTVRPVKDRAGVDLLVAPRRPVLDTIVTRNAAASGATLRLGTSVTGLRRDPADVTTVTGIDAKGLDGEVLEIDARVVVGADGLRSLVAREAGARLAQVRPPTGATYYAYFGGAVWPAIEFFVADQGMAGIFPTNRGEACIWACVPADQALGARQDRLGDGGSRRDARVARFHGLIERISPLLAERLQTARRTSLVRGAVGLPNQVRQAHGPGWALVGDALYHRDPITGHGISDAYRDAELLATSLDDYLHGNGSEPLGWYLADYERQAAEARQEIFDLTCALGTFPPVDEFVALQRRLSDAIETEATALATRPVPGPRRLAVA